MPTLHPPLRLHSNVTIALTCTLVLFGSVGSLCHSQVADFTRAIEKCEDAVFTFSTENTGPGATKAGTTPGPKPIAAYSFVPTQPNPTAEPTSSTTQPQPKTQVKLNYTWYGAPQEFQQSAVAVRNADGQTVVITLLDKLMAGSFSLGVASKSEAYTKQDPAVFDEAIGTALFPIKNTETVEPIDVADEAPSQGSPVVAAWIEDGNLIATHGIVASKARYHRALHREVVEISARVRPGSLGGPVLNQEGDLVGLIVASVSLKPESGTALMIPASSLDAALTTNADSGTTTLQRGFLGVHLDQDSETGDVIVKQVNPGSTAEEMELMVGDRIKTFDGQPIASVDDLVLQIRKKHAADEITIEFQRGGDEDSEAEMQEATAALKKGGAEPLQRQYLLLGSANISDYGYGLLYQPALQHPNAIWDQAARYSFEPYVPQASQQVPKNPSSPTTSYQPIYVQPQQRTPDVAKPAPPKQPNPALNAVQPGPNPLLGWQFVPSPVVAKGPRIEVERSDLEKAILNLSKQIEDLQQELKALKPRKK